MILIGELRDAETAQTALQAAESGHLVFSTLHTVDAAETVGRMIEFFPPAKQQQIRSVLAGVLRGVVSQRLLPRVDGGRVAAVEVMVTNARIADLIRETAHRGDRRRGRRGRLLRHADVRAGADRARPRRARSSARSRRTRPRTRTTSSSRSTTRSSARPPSIAQRGSAEAAEAAADETRGRGALPPRHPCRGGVMRRARRGALLVLALGVGSGVAPTRSPSSRRPQFVAAARRRRSRCRAPTSRTRRARSCCRPEPAEAPFLPVRERSYEELQALWLRAGAAYGIPWQVLAAINKIESNFGRNMGPSSAGAVGWMQFMPDTWLRWGTDADGDGIADPWNPEDAVFAAARYLAAAGGAHRHLARAVFAYNHAAVVRRRRARSWRRSSAATSARRRLHARPAGAQARGGAGGRSPSRARRCDAAESAAARARVARRAALDDARRRPGQLLSDRLDVEKDAFEVGQRERRGHAPRSSGSRRELTTGRGGARAGPQRRRTPRPSHPAAAGVLRRPERADGYVFPVGGGPGVRLRRRTHHHDYPAADIAGPGGRAGLRARRRDRARRVVDDGRCGIGIVLQTRDGLQWVYCHLSYRDPAVVPGAVLVAGQWVGLVGSTGHSTGPHLHLAAEARDELPAGRCRGSRSSPGPRSPGRTRRPSRRSGATPVFAVVPPVESRRGRGRVHD